MAEYRGPKGTRARRTIPATEAAKNFGRLVNRVRETQEVYVVERGGTPVAEIGPVGRSCTVGELVSLLKSTERLDDAYLLEVEAGIRRSNKPSVPVDRWER